MPKGMFVDQITRISKYYLYYVQELQYVSYMFINTSKIDLYI